MDRSEAERIQALLEKYDLPVTYAIKDVDRFYETFYLDKKSSDNAVTFIIPKHLGGVEITDAIDEKMVKDILMKFREE